MNPNEGSITLVANRAYESVKKPDAETRKTCQSKP